MKVAPAQPRAGIALIIVLISITVLSLLVAAFAYSMRVEMRLAMNSNSETELTWLGLSGVELARYVLAQQLTIAQEPYDSLNQVWAGGPGSMATSNSPLAGVSLTDYELGGGRFSVKITDLERKVNINIADQMVLERALELIGVDPGDFPRISGSILDWIDKDDVTHIGGTESDFYESLDPPYYAKNGPIDDMSELLLINGVTPDIYWGGIASNHLAAAFQQQHQRVFGGFNQGLLIYPVGLVDLFTPFSSGRININTASQTVLQMLPMVDEQTAAEIIRLRSGPDGVDGTEDDMPFRNPGELINAIPSHQVVGQIARLCDVRSRTFEVQVDAEISGYRRQFIAILGRTSPRDIQVLSFYWK
jgi:general secretion pathway protein K